MSWTAGLATEPWPRLVSRRSTSACEPSSTRPGAESVAVKAAGRAVEATKAAATVPSPVGPATRRSNGPPDSPAGTVAVSRSGACHWTLLSSTVPRKARNVASTSSPPPWPTRWLATGSKCSPRMLTGTSLAV